MNTTRFKQLIVASLLLMSITGCDNCEAGGRTDSDDLHQLLTTKKCKGCQIGATNLAGVNLAGADLEGAHLAGADLRRTNLRGANLVNTEFKWMGYYPARIDECTNTFDAKLEHADLTQVNLSRTRTGYVYLGGAKLYQANLSYATIAGDLTYTDLRQANLSHAILAADMTGADLRGTNLKAAYSRLPKEGLSSADLDQANLSGLDLSGTNLSVAKLNKAKLVSTNLEGADLEAADLQDADLQGANLNQADLREADLRGANLKGATLKGAIYGSLPHNRDNSDYDDKTKFPKGFDPVKAGMVHAKDPK